MYFPNNAPPARYVKSPYTAIVVIDIFAPKNEIIAVWHKTTNENKNGLKNGMKPKMSIANIKTIETM